MSLSLLAQEVHIYALTNSLCLVYRDSHHTMLFQSGKVLYTRVSLYYVAPKQSASKVNIKHY